MPQVCTERKSQSNHITGALREAAHGGLTIHPPVIAPVPTVPIRPEFIRLPRTGTACPHSGLSRSTLNSLILPCAGNGYKPSVRSCVLRQHGRLKGIRLIEFESLCSYIRSQANGVGQPKKTENVVPFNNAA
jgi:hypothetical protein